MSGLPAVFAHSDSGPLTIGAMLAVAVLVGVAGAWLVWLNRRLDREETGEDGTNGSTRAAWVSSGVFGGAVISVVVGIFLIQSAGPGSERQAVVDDLCLVAEQARDDPNAALATFNAGPHDALHDLETDLRREDPLLASELIASKEATEAALAERTGRAAELTTELAGQLAAAYERLEPAVDLQGCAP